MVSVSLDEVWNTVYEGVGEDLRVVTRYTASDFQTRMRDDVRKQYTSREDRAVVDDTIVKQLGLTDAESAFKAGKIQAFIRVFDDAYILSWPDGLPKKSGFIISVDRNGASATLADLEECIQYFENEIGSLSH